MQSDSDAEEPLSPQFIASPVQVNMSQAPASPTLPDDSPASPAEEVAHHSMGDMIVSYEEAPASPTDSMDEPTAAALDSMPDDDDDDFSPPASPADSVDSQARGEQEPVNDDASQADSVGSMGGPASSVGSPASPADGLDMSLENDTTGANPTAVSDFTDELASEVVTAESVVEERSHSVSPDIRSPSIHSRHSSPAATCRSPSPLPETRSRSRSRSRSGSRRDSRSASRSRSVSPVASRSPSRSVSRSPSSSPARSRSRSPSASSAHSGHDRSTTAAPERCVYELLHHSDLNQSSAAHPLFSYISSPSEDI